MLGGRDYYQVILFGDHACNLGHGGHDCGIHIVCLANWLRHQPHCKDLSMRTNCWKHDDPVHVYSSVIHFCILCDRMTQTSREGRRGSECESNSWTGQVLKLVSSRGQWLSRLLSWGDGSRRLLLLGLPAIGWMFRLSMAHWLQPSATFYVANGKSPGGKKLCWKMHFSPWERTCFNSADRFMLSRVPHSTGCQSQ